MSISVQITAGKGLSHLKYEELEMFIISKSIFLSKLFDIFIFIIFKFGP